MFPLTVLKLMTRGLVVELEEMIFWLCFSWSLRVFFSDLTRLNQMIMYSIFVQFNNLSHLFGARFFWELIQEGHRKQELEDIFLYGVSSGFFVWAQLFTLSTRRGTP